ncbi:MAG: SWIM zinc finger family protein [Bryobacterales bacterium]|nr:SWIM zinc finger family protein [Bryobacterales bacterium]
MPDDLSNLLTDTLIRGLAGAQSYQRGFAYFSNGQVASLDESRGGVRAAVHGTQEYTVWLKIAGGELEYSCDCPVGDDGAFCKHCVATALAWRNRAPKPQRRPTPKEPTIDDAGKLLKAEDKETVVRMILEWAKDDDRLRERLILYAARRSGPEQAVAAAWRAFQKAVRVRDFIDYREASSWAHDVSEAIGTFEQLLHDGHAAALIPRCESALRSLVGAIESVDDSDGHFCTLRDDLEDIHLRACQQAKPDPEELAERLFGWELQGGFDVFANAAERYAKVLGTKGLNRFRQLAEVEWKKVPVRTSESGRVEFGRHYAITSMMESLARASGDVEQLVAVISRDLSSGYNYWRIAEAYQKANRHDQALEWAEKGLKAFPERTDPRLREFAAEEYHRRKRHEDAVQLLWTAFLEHPYLETYQTLKKHAAKAGSWPQWRERALAEIRRSIAQAKEKARGKPVPHWSSARADHSLLVEIFLFERKGDEAWREAGEGGCSASLWLQLAAAREQEHPEDAGPIYLEQAEATLAQVSNGRYEETVELLVKAAKVMKRMDRSAAFVRHLEALRAKYKIKRNFIKLVEKKRSSLYLA